LELKDKIKKLTDIFAVSGDEYDVSKAAAELLEPYVDSVEIDVFGNVIGFKSCGIEGAPTLLLDAHIDQIGFLVTKVTDEGFLRFVGMGVDPRMLPGSELVVKTQNHGIIPGIVATLPPHMQKPGDNKKAVPIDEMFLDIGMTPEEAKSKVRVGDYMTFALNSFDLQGDAVCGKAMDDRACFVCILHAMELLKDAELKVNIVVVGATKEEQGGHGALAVGYRVMPEYAIAIDVCHAKTPDSGDQVSEELGKGPAITMGINSRPKFAKRMMEVARAKQIPYQLEIEPGATGTDAWAYQPIKEGICTLVMSLPLKYMHSPVEVLKMSDVENLGKLVAEFTKSFDGRL
jgi:endoglucanase